MIMADNSCDDQIVKPCPKPFVPKPPRPKADTKILWATTPTYSRLGHAVLEFKTKKLNFIH
mgnify:CR=1 FL=1